MGNSVRNLFHVKQQPDGSKLILMRRNAMLDRENFFLRERIRKIREALRRDDGDVSGRIASILASIDREVDDLSE